MNIKYSVWLFLPFCRIKLLTPKFGLKYWLLENWKTTTPKSCSLCSRRTYRSECWTNSDFVQLQLISGFSCCPSSGQFTRVRFDAQFECKTDSHLILLLIPIETVGLLHISASGRLYMHKKIGSDFVSDLLANSLKLWLSIRFCANINLQGVISSSSGEHKKLITAK
jgi:hypothetical protein